MSFDRDEVRSKVQKILDDADCEGSFIQTLMDLYLQDQDRASLYQRDRHILIETLTEEIYQAYQTGKLLKEQEYCPKCPEAREKGIGCECGQPLKSQRIK